jgi:hypothetical protein
MHSVMTDTPPRSSFHRPKRLFSSRKKLIKLAKSPTALQMMLSRRGSVEPASPKKSAR